MNIKTTTFKEYKKIINQDINKAKLLQSCGTGIIRVRYDYIPPKYQEKGEFIVWDENKVEDFNNLSVLYNDKGFLIYDGEYRGSYRKYKSKNSTFIWAFGIFEEHQNKGHGKVLLEELIKIANGKEIVVDTYTPSLIHLTNKYGLTLFPRDRKN